jgi:CxxC motif-containing protein (DUF1111 family)
MTTVKTAVMIVIVPLVMVGALQGIVGATDPLFVATDPGVRGGLPGAGGRIGGLTTSQKAFFAASREEFEETEGVDEGLGPSFNLDSCVGCHAQPASGGSSPAENPQVAAANRLNAGNSVPSFITLNGPVREARYKFNDDGTPDGGVHALFTIAGRDDAPGCPASQEDFEAQVANHNVIFRIPTPVFGAGLIEMIPDGAIEANRVASPGQKAFLGISGRANRNGNDGTIARFGWKAQNKSLLLFSGEAYNVEMGVSNDLFPDERGNYQDCQFAGSPNTVLNFDGPTAPEVPSAIEQFGLFMRFLAPPTPFVADTVEANASIAAGRQTFKDAGCALCHTPSFTSGNSSVAALANKPVRLFSDLLVHNMGPWLADQVSQGGAGGDEFRSAPLWGLGQRIFFLHDGRTSDLLEAIRAHRSAGNATFGPSEANKSVDTFNALSETSKQNVLNFLRSL